jgi:hypothetical protein
MIFLFVLLSIDKSLQLKIFNVVEPFDTTYYQIDTETSIQVRTKLEVDATSLSE